MPIEFKLEKHNVVITMLEVLNIDIDNYVKLGMDSHERLYAEPSLISDILIAYARRVLRDEMRGRGIDVPSNSRAIQSLIEPAPLDGVFMVKFSWITTIEVDNG